MVLGNVTTSAEAAPPRTLSDRLGKVYIGVRQDLEITRHLFRGQPEYLLRDPITGQSHRLSPQDYTVFVNLHRDYTLHETFIRLVREGLAVEEDEEKFYRFVVMLHHLNFLHLPLSDEKRLYQRYLARQSAAHRQRWCSLLFLRVPLLNPDAFLKRTVHRVRFLYSGWFLAIWLVVVGAAGYVALRQWDQFTQPTEGLLATRNLALMWVTLIGLKVIHEFGHAYACKHFGGHVPEMGVYLIVLTPMAYVDATASWGFTRKRERLIVCLAGMYIEIFVAAAALFVWSMTLPGLLHDVAFNIVFLAGVLTVVFNINPLMRYDGYYVLSDLLEIPNLRQRAVQYLMNIGKRLFLGLRIEHPIGGHRERWTLLTFGLCTSLYRATVFLAIGVVVAYKFGIPGLLLAGLLLGGMIFNKMLALTRYLWHARETAPVRARAVVVSILALLVIPGGLALVPIPGTVRTPGVLQTDRETIVRARVEGVVRNVHLEIGQMVRPEDVLVELRNEDCEEAVAIATAALQSAEILTTAYETTEPVTAMRMQEQAGVCKLDLQRRQKDLDALRIRARLEGYLLDGLTDRDSGRFVRQGEPIAAIGTGRWQVRTFLTEQEVADVRPTVGQLVEVRFHSDPGLLYKGIVRLVMPTGLRNVSHDLLTQKGEGEIAIDPLTGGTTQPYFEVVIDLSEPPAKLCQYGMTCKVNFDTHAAPVGVAVVRALLRFTHAIMQG